MYLVFDSDLSHKPEVQRAAQQLAEVLRAAGADVRMVHLPPGQSGAKVGLDDFLIAQGPDALRRLIEAAIVPGPPKPPPSTGRPPIVTVPEYIPFPIECLPPGLRAIPFVLAQPPAP